MIVANNKDGNRVSIDFAIQGEPYFCPLCNQPLIQKRGQIRQHHFAHVGDKNDFSPCSDNWIYDKTDWHIEWQKRFPDSCYEKVLVHGDKKHIADVLINGYIIEFQHSSISLEDFEARNSFYSSCGYRVIWVFDMAEEFSDGKISESLHRNEYLWSYPKKLFREMNFKNIQATIYFQFDYNENKDFGVLERVTSGYNRFTKFYTDQSNALSIPTFIEYVSKGDSRIYPQKYQSSNAPDSISGGKTIYELWQPKYSGMVVKNLANGKEMLINGKKGKIYREDNNPAKKIIGKYSNVGYDGKYHYSDYYPVWDDDKAIWSLKKEFISQEYLEQVKIDKEIAERNIVGKTLVQMLISTQLNVFHCLYNDKCYWFEFASNNRLSYNVYEINPMSGEILGSHCNEEVIKLRDKPVWEEYNS